ncbi:MAG: hypothetical protein PHV32_18375 [Eubacteriales bacterium]|nr:hypothetical protein [Eubacteriales bacterium]
MAAINGGGTPSYIFCIRLTACKVPENNNIAPLKSENGKDIIHELFLPASSEQFEEADKFTETYSCLPDAVCKYISAGKYPLDIRHMTIIDMESLNISARLIEELSPEQVQELSGQMESFEYEYDLQDACEQIVGHSLALNQS